MVGDINTHDPTTPLLVSQVLNAIYKFMDLIRKFAQIKDEKSKLERRCVALYQGRITKIL